MNKLIMEKRKNIDVVYIEDNQDDSELTEFALNQASDVLLFRHFRDGNDALEFILASNADNGHRIQSELKFVIIDIGLPRMNGLEVLRRIRADKVTRRLPVIILTSSRDHEYMEVAYHLGANSYVVKPDSFDRYIKKIGSLAYYWSNVNEKSF